MRAPLLGGGGGGGCGDRDRIALPNRSAHPGNRSVARVRRVVASSRTAAGALGLARSSAIASFCGDRFDHGDWLRGRLLASLVLELF